RNSAPRNGQSGSCPSHHQIQIATGPRLPMSGDSPHIAKRNSGVQEPQPGRTYLGRNSGIGTEPTKPVPGNLISSDYESLDLGNRCTEFLVFRLADCTSLQSDQEKRSELQYVVWHRALLLYCTAIWPLPIQKRRS